MGGGGPMNNPFLKNQEFTAEEDIKTRFTDVEGIDAAKDELEEIVDFLKQPERYYGSGAKIPRGALLAGKPGTGKTLLARAIAGESNVPFIQCSAANFVEMFVGVGAKRVRDLFEVARANQPCIVFIDEIDAVGKQRSAGGAPANDEREQTINQLLTEMDGFDNETGIVVIAATNRIDILDDALLRPGRFDRKITVALPSVRGREKILGVHARDKKLAEDVKLRQIAKQTTGFSGAELANLLNECAIRAVRDGNGTITNEIVENVYQRIIVGAKGDTKFSPKRRSSSRTTKLVTPSLGPSYPTTTPCVKSPSFLEEMLVGSRSSNPPMRMPSPRCTPSNISLPKSLWPSVVEPRRKSSMAKIASPLVLLVTLHKFT